MYHVLTRFWRDERGATAIEYGLIAAIVGVGIVASLQNLTEALNGMFGSVAEAFDE